LIQDPSAQASAFGNNDALLAGLANGHNETMVRIVQLQDLTATTQSRLVALEANTTTNTATLGEVHRALQTVLARLNATPTFPIEPTMPPAPVLIAPPVLSTTPAAPATTPSLADFTAAMQSTLTAALRETKRPRDDDNDGVSRNVRPRTDAVHAPVVAPAAPVSAPGAFHREPPVSVSTHGRDPPISTPTLVHAPAAASTSNPPRRPNERDREVRFGPAIWASNVVPGARTIVSEGLPPAKPLLRSLSARKIPDPHYIILSFDTAEIAAWFVDEWTTNRVAWATIHATLNV
jgi:hypothetical protein